tara:strand:+ start:12394 stop:12783 length:390 start_codon:yes stop_codon:yes gene_type:complete
MGDYYKHPSNYVWWVERNQVAISQSTDGETFSGPGAGSSMRIFAYKTGNEFTTGATISNDMNETTDIPEEFHETIFAKANEILFERSSEQLGTAQYWKDKYTGGVIEAKKYANRNRDARDIYTIKGTQY